MFFGEQMAPEPRLCGSMILGTIGGGRQGGAEVGAHKARIKGPGK